MRSMETITRSKWNNLPRDFKTGDPRRGTAKALMFIEGQGTCLVPVSVVEDHVGIGATMDRHEAVLSRII